MEPALMRAKPRCGHVVTSFPKATRPALLFFEISGDEISGFCLPVLNRIERSVGIVPAIIVHVSHSRQHCPHSGTPNAAGMHRP